MIVSICQDEGVLDYSNYETIRQMVEHVVIDYCKKKYGRYDLKDLIKPGSKVVIKPNLVMEKMRTRI